MVFHWSLSDSKSPQAQYSGQSQQCCHLGCLHSSSHFQVLYQSFSDCNGRANYITITFIFHSFFSSLRDLGAYISFCFPSVLPCSQLERQNPLFGGLSFFSFSFFFFFLPITRFGHLAEISWSVGISKSQRKDGFELCIYHFFIWSNLNFMHNSQWITFPAQLCLVLYPLYANLLHSLIIWLIVSSLSPHYLHLLFCCVLSILALT